MADFYFSSEEKAFMEKVIEKGLLQKKGNQSPQWWVARLALSISLRISAPLEARDSEIPKPISSELHMAQITGEGKGPHEDYTDAICLLLSTYHNRDLFDDRKEFIACLQAHLRRGLREMQASWRENFDFHDYLYQDLFFDTGSTGGDGSAPLDAGVTQATLERGLGQLGIRAQIAQRQDGPRLTRYTLVLGSVSDYDRLRSGLDDLAFTIGLGAATLTMDLAPGERRVYLDVPRPMASWAWVGWPSVRERLSGTGYALPVCPGTDILGNPYVFDLAEAPHLLIGGTTGSGKSMCVAALLLSLLEGPRPPELVLIDPKAVEFRPYDGCRLVRGRAAITDMGEASAVLRTLVDEMAERQSQCADLGVKSIAEAQAKGSPLRRLVVVIDELADLLQQHRDVADPLIRLAQKARAFGIHLILATQRPDAATFNGLLRSNVPSRIALTVQKSAESRIILDESGAETLLMRGDMLVRLAGRPTERVHGARVDSADIVAAVAAAGRE